MPQPDTRGGLAAFLGGQIDAPDQAGKGIRDQHDPGRDQAGAVEALGGVGKLEDGLQLDRLARCPAAQVQVVQVRLVGRVEVARDQIKHVGLGFDDPARDIRKLVNADGFHRP